MSPAWKKVGWSMLAGAAYDGLFALGLLFFRGLTAEVLGLELPASPVHLGLNAIFLAMLAAFYAIAAREPQRYRGVVIVAGVGRMIGGLFLTYLWITGNGAAFLGLALGDFLFGSLHLRLWWAARLDG